MSSKTIVISDLHAEINPKKVIDLERVATLPDIQRSYDLKVALSSKYLELIKHSIVPIEEKAVPTPVKIIEKHTEKIIERDKLEDARLIALIKAAVSESVPEQKAAPVVNADEAVNKAVNAKVGQVNVMLREIRDKIANFRPGYGPQENEIETLIDPALLAEMAGKSVDKIAGEIESGTIKKSRKIKITPTKPLDDLASELD